MQEQETLGIVPVFWKDEQEEWEGPAILTMVGPGQGRRGRKETSCPKTSNRMT
jgi:hypothetical protein